MRNKFQFFFGSCYVLLQLSYEKKMLRVLIGFRLFHSVDVDTTTETSPVISTNQKRKADEMESNQPNELRTIKVQKTEPMARKYRK